MLPCHEVSAGIALSALRRCPQNTDTHHTKTRGINAFLDRPDVRETIGVDPRLTSNFSQCNNDVVQTFRDSLDWQFPAQHYIGALLERGIRALIYVGANDWICNWVCIRKGAATSLAHNVPIYLRSVTNR